MSSLNTNELDRETGEITPTGNPPFFQFYKHNIAVIRHLSKNNPRALELFLFLVEHMDINNAILISQEALMEVLDLKRTTVYNRTKYLVNNDFIKVIKSGSSNIYCVNADIVWTRTDENKKFAKFTASVYVTESEQLKGLRGDKKISKHLDLIGHYQKDIFDDIKKPDAGIQQSDEFDS